MTTVTKVRSERVGPRKLRLKYEEDVDEEAEVEPDAAEAGGGINC